MKLFRHIVLGTLVALAAVSAALWMRSNWMKERIVFSTPGGRLVTISTLGEPDGAVKLTIVRDWPVREPLRWLTMDDRVQVYWLRGAPGARTRWEWLDASATWAYEVTSLYNGVPRELTLMRDRMFIDESVPDGESPPLAVMRVVAPFWLLLLLTALGPVVVLLRRIDRARTRRRRARAGLCLECGYDLRESPDRCPECGAMTV